MDRTLQDSTNGRADAPRASGYAALTICAVLGLCACASTGEEGSGAGVGADGRPSQISLQRLANSTLSTGNVRVRFSEGVAYVTGNVQTAIDANGVARVLRNAEGVERVELRLQRGM